MKILLNVFVQPHYWHPHSDLPEYLYIENICPTDVKKLGMSDEAYQNDIPVEPICDPNSEWLTPKASAIFSEIYDKYIDPSFGKMTRETASLFIFAVSNNMAIASDSRIDHIFKTYAKTDPN